MSDLGKMICDVCIWADEPHSPGSLCEGGMCDDALDKYMEDNDIETEPDGDMICAHRSDFVDLQESVAGFGPTRFGAVQNLLDNEEAMV